jgi:hypothetical protein
MESFIERFEQMQLTLSAPIDSRSSVVRYIMTGGEFPEDNVVDFMKKTVYPSMCGKLLFPGFGPTIFTPEQEIRRQTLKRAVGIHNLF